MNDLPGLNTRSLGRAWLHLEEVDSTNDYLKAHAAGLPHGAAVTATRQTGGKGRRGRSWGDTPGQGLALSVLLRQGIRLEDMTLLPLLTGLGVCRGLRDMSGADFAVKWSNDILLGGRKICGILCESRILPGNTDISAVLGIGVNLLQNAEDFARLDLVYATSLLLDTGNAYTPEQAASAVLNALEEVLDLWLRSGFEALLPEYRSLCVTLGREVRVLREGQEQEALAEDIAPDGSLLCRDAAGRCFSVTAGETSVRGLYGYV